MKKNFRMTMFVILVAFVFLLQPNAFSDDEGMEAPDPNIRMMENVPAQDKDWVDRLREHLLGKPIDPLDAGSLEDAQAHQEVKGERLETAAEFVEATTALVSAGTPSPNIVSTAGTTAVSAGVSAATSPEPSAWQRFKNWVSSFF